MTKKQIEQKAEKYSDAFIAKGVAKASYIKGYKEATKELEPQIDKMKCCANCWKYYRGENVDDKGYLCGHHDFNDKCELWELEE